MNGTPPEKIRLRAEVLARRDALTEETRADYDDIITRAMERLEDWTDASTVLLYAAFRSEAGTSALVQRALEAGKTVALPLIRRGSFHLDLFRIEKPSDLSPGTLGIPEPPRQPGRQIPPEAPDLVAVPGVVFDRRGYRIGYGGGYYDRLLPKLRPDARRIGLAYGTQLIDRVPAEPHDERVHAVLTERGLIVCRQRYDAEEGR